MAKPRKTDNSNTTRQDPAAVQRTASSEHEPSIERSGPPQSGGDTTSAMPDRERVARRAYERYLERGGAEGGAMDDWLEAERELATDRERRSE